MIILTILLMLFLGEASILEASEDMEFPFSGRVCADNVNIRAGASVNFEALCQLNRMDKVIVVGEVYQWYEIKLPSKVKCFISRDYVYRVKNYATLGSEADVSNGAYIIRKEGIISADNVNVRSGRGTKYSSLGQVNSGDSVTILEEYKDWFQIKPPQGSFAWVHSDFIKYAQTFTKKAKKAEKPLMAKSSPIAVGTIYDLGVIINRPGRCKLVGDNGRIFYLKSVSIDLTKYVYYRVRLWGNMRQKKELKYPLIEVEEIELVK